MLTRRRLSAPTLAVLITAIAWITPVAAQNGLTPPEQVGLSREGLAAATAGLQAHIDAGDIPGVVAAVARDGQTVYFEALGSLELEQGTPMPTDALFRIYSMTRQITSVAILMLEADGLLSVSDPVQKYLPEFAGQTVFADPRNPDPSRTRPRVGDITLAHLLTHTGGIGARSEPVYVQHRVRDRALDLDQVVANVARMPLFSDPGTTFRYGMSATVLGKVVEIVSGESLEDFLQRRLFTPVGMTDTVFHADARRAPRLAPVYRPTEGRLQRYEIETLPHTEVPALIEGGVGLLSTVGDFLRFSQMLLNGGEIDGRRVLTPDTVAKVFANAVPPAALPLDTRGYWLGSGWTLGGFNVVLDPQTYAFPVSPGTIWWDGSAGTRYFIDPQTRVISVIMAQVSPASGGGFREDFKTAVDAAILQP